MRRALAFGYFIVLLAFCGSVAAKQFVPTAFTSSAGGGTFTPAIISHYRSGIDNTPNNANNYSNPSFAFYTKTPTGFIGGANNCATMFIMYPSPWTLNTPTDDQSETWTQVGGTATDSTNKESMQLWTVSGTTAGTRKITVTFAGSSTTTNMGGLVNVGAVIDEHYNCGSFGGNGTLSTAATGSALTLTLSQAPSSGDETIGAFYDTDFSNTCTGSCSPGEGDTITAGANFSFKDVSSFYADATEVSTTSTSTSVQITYSGTHPIIGVAAVIHKGAAGNGPPSGKYIETYNVDQVSGAGTSPTVHLPCTNGNLIVFINDGGSNSSNGLTGISGSSGTWATAVTNAGNNIAYGKGVTCSSGLTISPTYGSSPAGGTDVVMISVANANANPLDTTANTSGTQNGSAANLTGVSITPAATGEIVFNQTSIAFHDLWTTVTDANSHTPVPMFATNNKDDDASGCTGTNGGTGNSALDEDNGFSFIPSTTNTTAITFIYGGSQVTGTGSCTTNPTGVQGWQSIAAAFK